MPPAFEAQTGAKFLKDKRDSIGAVGRYLRNALQAFAILALLVGGFVIYNTFSVIVAQRTRELAVLSAIGATPKQIKRMLRWEGIVIGLLGSALGLLAGIALTFVLIAVLKAAGAGLAGSGLKVEPRNVVQALVLGTAITVASVMIPARRAARTEPVEAMRSSAVEAADAAALARGHRNDAAGRGRGRPPVRRRVGDDRPRDPGALRRRDRRRPVHRRARRADRAPGRGAARA